MSDIILGILFFILFSIYNFAIFYIVIPQIISHGKQIDNLNEQIKKENIKDDIKVIKKD
jgi:hypothetical protein